ncbi:MAG: CocE/NonD family hydrolase [Cyanobacteriota bacterium]
MGPQPPGLRRQGGHLWLFLPRGHPTAECRPGQCRPGIPAGFQARILEPAARPPSRLPGAGHGGAGRKGALGQRQRRPRWALGLAWALQLAAQGCRRGGDAEGWQEIRRSLESGSFLHDGLALLQRHDPEGMGLEWLGRDPLQPQGWRRHAVLPALLRRPMLLIGGWHDPHLRGVLALWQASREAGGQPQLRIGQWTHLDWQGGIDALQLEFFQRHLPTQAEATATPAVRPAPAIALQWRQSGSGEQGWLEQGLQPGAAIGASRLAQQGWSLASDGLAAISAAEGRLQAPGKGSGSVALVHDPWRPVPGRGGHLGLDAGLVERGDLDRRADVVCFSSAPMEQPLELLGIPWVRLTVAADQPGHDLCLALSALAADGPGVQQLSTGVARFRGEQCLVPTQRLIRLQPLFVRVAAGQRLRLSIAAAAWPQIAVNPGNGSVPRGGTSPDHREITLLLNLAESHLWLEPLTGAN